MRFFLFILLNIISIQLFATKVTAIADGDWNDPLTWDDVPPTAGTCYDDICIPATFSVTLSADEDLSACGAPVLIAVEGTLTIAPTTNLALPCGDSGIIIPGGGILVNGGGTGVTSTVKVCGDNIWIANDGDISGAVILSDYFSFFDLKAIEDQIEISWQMEAEMNSSRFEIERSWDGNSWQTITTLTASEIKNFDIPYYSYRDENSNPGINYYRIKQFNYDGGIIYSEIKSINHLLQNKELTIFPIPSLDGNITVYYPHLKGKNMTTSLYSLGGNIVYQDEFKVSDQGYIFLSFPSSLPNGTYFLKVNGIAKKIVLGAL